MKSRLFVLERAVPVRGQLCVRIAQSAQVVLEVGLDVGCALAILFGGL